MGERRRMEGSKVVYNFVIFLFSFSLAFSVI